MTFRFLGGIAAALALGAAGLAHAGTTTVDLSPYVNQSFFGWVVDGGNYYNDLAGQTTTGNLGSNIPFAVANTAAGNNFWYGLDDGTGTNNLFNGPQDSFTIPITVSGVQTVYTLADNTFGTAGADEFNITFQGTGGAIVGEYIGAQNTRDYWTVNCNSTGCDATPLATNWYDGGDGAIIQQQTWNLPANFGLTSITFTQVDPAAGAFLAGVSLGTPEPATWAMMIMGFGFAGAALRRRRAVLATA